jgi:peptidoglycan hydrolase-like protein with peptidoglycan-binding domain
MVGAIGPVTATLALLGCLIGALMAGAAPAAAADPAAADPASAPGVAPSENEDDAPVLDDKSVRDLVTDAQRLLMLRGFDSGPLDGTIGLRTRRAIRAYQAAARAHGVLEAMKPASPGEKVIQPAAGPEPPLPEPTPPAPTK